MKLDNHIVNRLLTDKDFAMEVVLHTSTNEGRDLLTSKDLDSDVEHYVNLYDSLQHTGNRTYYVANSVIDKLKLLDAKKCMKIEGWLPFKTVPDFKKTFILPDPTDCKYGGSRCVRVVKKNGMLFFFHLTFRFCAKEERTRTYDGEMYYIMLYVNLEAGELCENMNSKDGLEISPFLYSLMCFVELCDNEIKVIEPKQQYGTQKTGKIINTTPFPITVINNNWNITTIKSEGFPVSGHVALYWTGPGRSIPKMLYVEPYMKDGYTRKAGKLAQQS